MEVVVQAEVGTMTIILRDVDAAQDAIDRSLDAYTKSIGRQLAKFDLGIAIRDFIDTRNAIDAYPEHRVEYQKARALERARLREGMAQQHYASHKRGEFKPNGAQQQALASFDAATEAELAKQDGLLENKKENLLIYKAAIERHRRIVNGEEQLEEPLQQAAAIELPMAAE